MNVSRDRIRRSGPARKSRPSEPLVDGREAVHCKVGRGRHEKYVTLVSPVQAQPGCDVSETKVRPQVQLRNAVADRPQAIAREAANIRSAEYWRGEATGSNQDAETHRQKYKLAFLGDCKPR